jgi:hypothetical protein
MAVKSFITLAPGPSVMYRQGMELDQARFHNTVPFLMLCNDFTRKF